MRLCVLPGRFGLVGQYVDDEGLPLGTPSELAALPALPAETRLVWPDCTAIYPQLWREGSRVERCHDLALTEGLLLGHEGHWGRPRSLAAAWARLHGTPVPDDLPDADEGTLFGPGAALTDADTGADADADAGAPLQMLQRVIAVHADQLTRIAAARHTSPGFGLLVAAESASGLAAVEMSAAGLPWDARVHDGILTGALGPRPAHGGRPAKLAALAEQVSAAFGDQRLNPDSQPELLRALRRAGITVTSTRRHQLRGVEHPVIEPLLRYKELARLHAANGWAWREQWVHDGRFRPEYVPGGVVSGRWATRGGGALQIPKLVRAAVVAPAGSRLVIADAGQLEPRVLAAMSGDPGMIAATRAGDLYTDLASQAFGRGSARAEAKIGLLSAMYGGGAGSTALAALRRRFPTAFGFLEQAAMTGEEGGSVRSVLGRTSPSARTGWLDGLTEEDAVARARARGRFTRNFVVQASAADWASVLLAGLRTELAGTQARLVFFQHDEVIVEVPQEQTAPVVEAIRRAGRQASALVLGGSGVDVPLDGVVVDSYAQKP